MPWAGPFRIRDLLENSLDHDEMRRLYEGRGADALQALPDLPHVAAPGLPRRHPRRPRPGRHRRRWAPQHRADRITPPLHRHRRGDQAAPQKLYMGAAHWAIT